MTTLDEPVVASVPADVDAPDRVLYGLTARQAAILATTGALLWLAYRALTPLVAPLVVGVAALPVAAVAATLALGRRDGISMDRWVWAAVVAARAPRRLVAAGDELPGAPAWAPMPRVVACVHKGRSAGAVQAPPVAPLRLPASAIADSGVIDLEAGGRVALTAASTVNVDLRTPDEQHALVDGLGRWLNSLSAPVQIVVSTRPVDMHAYADLVDARIDDLSHPALADAATDYAQFLRWLGGDRDPLDRHVVIAHRTGAHADAPVARRYAEQTARALTGLGAATRTLDGGLVTDVLVSACDPWRTARGGRATPGAVITSHANGDLP
jgi:hypothetical protein